MEGVGPPVESRAGGTVAGAREMEEKARDEQEEFPGAEALLGCGMLAGDEAQWEQVRLGDCRAEEARGLAHTKDWLAEFDREVDGVEPSPCCCWQAGVGWLANSWERGIGKRRLAFGWRRPRCAWGRCRRGGL